MNAEERRIHCGLLMFDAPTVSTRSQTSRSNDIIINNLSTQGVDSSTLNNHLSYESSRNAGSLVNNLDMFHDCTSDFSTTTRVLAAGAAAGGELLQQGSCDSSDEPGQRSSLPQKRIPRPPNAFILYRREKQPAIIAANRHLSNAEVSRRISEMWRSEPEETRREWERYADRKKLEHMQTYPNYVYRPNKNKSKIDKRRQQRKQSSPRDSTDNRSYSISSGATTGPQRRKSTRNGNKSPAKSDFPEGLQQSSINDMSQSNINSRNDTSRNNSVPSNSSFATLIPSPEIPTLVDPHAEYGSQQQINSVTSHLPLTPISPPQVQCEQEFKARHQQQYGQNLYVYHDNQGNTPQLPFTSVISYNQGANGYPLEYYFAPDVPDVAQQQQQMNAETMLHYEHHQITPTPTVSSSNNPSPNERTSLYPQQPTQYFHNETNTAGNVIGNQTFVNFLAGYEYQNLLGGSVNHHIQ
ncbi:9326_t:CDS:1 [Dentiscutata erythropus]|uniref:9326_t:CDS:1 n=1 Tax=Dentiscutata erythropus TaxID=1348616 RepID=A0A9N8ZGI9_9GLOM|nr:9326_t:CDS:1 [Dentiscutata erythropus]